jgi:predicted MPP superfamily phosphohydrolase
MANLSDLASSKIEEARKLGTDSRMEGQLRAAKSLIADLRKSNEAKDRQIQTLEETIDLICLMEDTRKKAERVIVPKSKANEAVPIFIWFDWHVEELVDKRKTLGKNEFNLKIAEARAKRCAESTVKMLRHVRLSSHVRSCLLVLGGDFITGDIHQELCETNLLGPAEACVFARELLATGLEAIRAEKYLQQIRVVCIVGNHGRTTKKMQFKNGAEKSFESIIYAELARQFADKRFEFTIARGGVEMVPDGAGV